MLPMVSEIKVSGKSTDQIIAELVDTVNLLAQQVRLALQNVDMSDVVAESGVTLEDLLSSGALKGETGAQGPDGKVWRPTVSAAGIISWVLTDEGGITPTAANIKGSPGETGAPGQDGAGVPAGGTTGQVLQKASDADYDTAWVTL